MQQQDSHQRQVSPRRPNSASEEIQNMHDVFSDPYRCAVLYYLQASEEPATVREVANAVLDWSPEGADDPERTERSRAWLLDNHLLQMDEFGIVAYDGSRDVVRLSEDVSVSVTSPWQE